MSILVKNHSGLLTGVAGGSLIGDYSLFNMRSHRKEIILTKYKNDDVIVFIPHSTRFPAASSFSVLIFYQQAKKQCVEQSSNDNCR